MFRRILSILFVIVALGIIIAGYFYLKNRNRPIPELVNAIPIDASFIIQGDDFIKMVSDLNQNNQILEELTSIETVFSFRKQMAYIDSIAGLQKELTDIILSQPYAISAHLSANDQLDYLFLFRLSELINEKLALNIIVNLSNNLQGRTYEKTKIYTLFTGKNNPDYFFSIYSGIIFVSESEVLVESALRQLRSSPKISDFEEFKKVASTAGDNVDANFYVNYQYFLKALSIPVSDTYKDLLANYNQFAEWSELDINIKPESLLLNGFTYANDSNKLFINSFKGQEAGRIDIHEILPANTATALMLYIDNYPLFLHKYQQNLVSNNRKKEFAKYQERLKDFQGINLTEEFNSFFDEQVALIYTDISNLTKKENTYLVIKTKSNSLSRDKMKGLIDSYARNNQMDPGQLKQTIAIDRETRFAVYRMPLKQFGKQMFGDFFESASCNYFCFFDNYLVFGHSPEMLKSFIHANLLQKTLVNNQIYLDFYDHLSARSNLYFYCNIARSEKVFKQFLNTNLNAIYSKNASAFSKFQSFGYQFLESRDMFYNNLYLQYNPTYTGKSNTIWESHLDNDVMMKPALVVNHYTRNQEIFVQDTKNQVYLINNKGRILWKKKLSEPIMSEVFQVDFYKNGKLQILFNTQNQIHLLDRNGNYVERYPINLSYKATNGLQVFDYDNNKNYRIFIALANKSVRLYNIEGNIVPGWNFEKTEHVVKKEVQFFRVSNRDYLVFHDSLRIYICNRRGNERVKLQKQFRVSENNPFVLEYKNAKSNSRLVTTDYKGVIHYIYFDGSVQTHVAERFSPFHYFDYHDIDKDGFRDFIFLDKNMLKVMNRNNKTIFHYKFAYNISQKPVCYMFPGREIKIGIVSDQEGMIYLINNEGILSEGFPMLGKTLFSIGKLTPMQEKYNLIVGGEDNFLYNYYLN